MSILIAPRFIAEQVRTCRPPISAARRRHLSRSVWMGSGLEPGIASEAAGDLFPWRYGLGNNHHILCNAAHLGAIYVIVSYLNGRGYWRTHPPRESGFLWDLLRYRGWMNARRGIIVHFRSPSYLCTRGKLRRTALVTGSCTAADAFKARCRRPRPASTLSAFPCLSITHQTINRYGLTGGAGGPR